MTDPTEPTVNLRGYTLPGPPPPDTQEDDPPPSRAEAEAALKTYLVNSVPGYLTEHPQGWFFRVRHEN